MVARFGVLAGILGVVCSGVACGSDDDSGSATGGSGGHFLPTGMVLPNSSQAFDFGPNFVSRPDVLPVLDRWYCYEYMLRANTPGQRDGRITIWVDGRLTADFPNLHLRDVASLKIDRFGLSFHIGSNPNGVSKKWYDNVVAAKSYIGPVSAP